MTMKIEKSFYIRIFPTFIDIPARDYHILCARFSEIAYI